MRFFLFLNAGPTVNSPPDWRRHFFKWTGAGVLGTSPAYRKFSATTGAGLEQPPQKLPFLPH